MKVAADIFLVQVTDSKNSFIKIKGINGESLSVDTDYNKTKHSVQIGKIFATPIAITNKYENDTPINVGDVVVFHHFVCMPDHKMPIESNIFRAEYFHIYGKIENDTIMPIEDVIFVEPILEPKENMFAGSIQLKAERGYLKQQGVVFAASKKAKAMGVLPGDIIFYTHNADYPMEIVGKQLYRMRIRNIVGIKRNGNLVCLSDKILVKEGVDDEPKKLFCEEQKLQLKGEIVEVGSKLKGVNKGDKVSYYNAIGGNVSHIGSKFSLVELRHINYITDIT